jgi:probable HAF family extracellular repeat protein
MKLKILTCMIAMILCAALALPLAAQTQQPHNNASQYTVTTLSPVDTGDSAAAITLNNTGYVMGSSNLTPGGLILHAALWRKGQSLDLGTLAGLRNDLNSAVVWPNHNNQGRIVGISETADVNPLGEAWSCYLAEFNVFTGHNCLGFVWKNGVMTPLPTLGGFNGFGASTNNRGQVVGWSETTYHDPTCNTPQVLQFLATLWEPEKNQVRALNPLPGDSDSAATAINDRGQAVGISGICANAVGGLSAKHMVLWQNGTATEIPNLGGVAWNTPMAINNRGDVVGFSDVPGDSATVTKFHAFLWTKEGGTQNLGTLPGDTTSQALGINDKGQVVGFSYGGPNGPRAFLWENGAMTDLNSLVPSGSLHLTIASDINNRGEIAGSASDPNTGKSPAFLAAPSHR